MIMNKLNWVVELNNNIILDSKNLKKISEMDIEKIKSIYFTDNNNRYGFYVKGGIFFVNNMNIDLKNLSSSDEICAFQHTTNRIMLKDNETNIDSKSIGYEIKNKKEKYTMKIFSDSIFLLAERMNNDGEKEEKIIKIR